VLEAQSPITDVEVADLRQVDAGGDAHELIRSASLRRWMAVRNTTFSGARALGLVLVLDATPGKRELEALRIAVESALLPRILVVLDAVGLPSPLKLKIPKVLAGRDPHVGVLVIRDPLGSPYGAGVGGTALGVPRLSDRRSDEELREESIRAVVEALREPAVFQATWQASGGDSWRAVSSVGLYRGVLGGYSQQATADQAGRLAELLEGHQLETIAGSTVYPELSAELAGTAFPPPLVEGGEPNYEPVIPDKPSDARRVYEQSYSAAETAHSAFAGLIGPKPKGWLPFMWSRWVTALLRPWHSRMAKAQEAARQIREARNLQDAILDKADFSDGVSIAQVDAARKAGVEVMTLLPEKYDVVELLRDEVAGAFGEIRLLRAPRLAALNLRDKARRSRPRSPQEAREHLAQHLDGLGIERALVTIEKEHDSYTPGSAVAGTYGGWLQSSGRGFFSAVVETLVITGPRKKFASLLKLAIGLVVAAAALLVTVQVITNVIDAGWPALKVNWFRGWLDEPVPTILDWMYFETAPFLMRALAVVGVALLIRTLIGGAASWIGSAVATLFRRLLELTIFFGLLKVFGLIATEVLGRTLWAYKVPPLDRCPDLSLRGVPGELCRVGAEALDRVLWFSPQGQHLGHYALQGLGVASVLMLVSLILLTRGRNKWNETLARDGFTALASLPTEKTALGGNPLWAAWASIIYNDWHHASFRFHASEIFAIATDTVKNWTEASAKRLREIQTYLTSGETGTSALEEFHSPAFETTLDHVGRGGEYAGYLSGLNLFAADVALIGGRAMDLQWERMRGPARSELPIEVMKNADESMQKYLSNLASSDLLHRSVRESAPASDEDDGHARAINQLRQDLRDAWGSESVISTLYSQVFGRDEQAGSERVIQFIAPEEFNLLDTRETEPPIIRFAPHGAAEELRIDGLVATESFSAAGSIRIIPIIESAWSFADPTDAAQAKSDASSRSLRRFVPRAGVVAEVLNSFGTIEAIERRTYPIPENDDDLIGGPAVKPEPEPAPEPEVAPEEVPEAAPGVDGQPEATDGEVAAAVEGLAPSEGEPEQVLEIEAQPDTKTEERPGLLRRFINRFLGRVPAAAPEPALDEELDEKPKRRSRRKPKADDVAADGDEAVEGPSKRRKTKRGSLATEPKKRSRKKKSAEE
jgi:hypothetical protein